MDSDQGCGASDHEQRIGHSNRDHIVPITPVYNVVLRDFIHAFSLDCDRSTIVTTQWWELEPDVGWDRLNVGFFIDETVLSPLAYVVSLCALVKKCPPRWGLFAVRTTGNQKTLFILAYRFGIDDER